MDMGLVPHFAPSHTPKAAMPFPKMAEEHCQDLWGPPAGNQARCEACLSPCANMPDKWLRNLFPCEAMSQLFLCGHEEHCRQKKGVYWLCV